MSFKSGMEDHPLKVHCNKSRLRAVILSPSISKLQNAQRQFGQRIQTQREHKGISQEQLSKDCGITLTNLKLLESGEAEAHFRIAPSSHLSHQPNSFAAKHSLLLKGSQEGPGTWPSCHTSRQPAPAAQPTTGWPVSASLTSHVPAAPRNPVGTAEIRFPLPDSGIRVRPQSLRRKKLKSSALPQIACITVLALNAAEDQTRCLLIT
jgi:DNA-binding XRE family transcriptional regulator